MAQQSDPNNNKELEQSISHGVSPDHINVRRVSFWFMAGIIIISVSLFGLYHFYSYNQFLSSQQAAIDTSYEELEKRLEEEQRILNTFELIDEEDRRYRIPIDSAMTLIADK